MPTIKRLLQITVDPDEQAAVDRALEGVREPVVMRQAAERMDRMREEMQAARG